MGPLPLLLAALLSAPSFAQEDGGLPPAEDVEGAGEAPCAARPAAPPGRAGTTPRTAPDGEEGAPPAPPSEDPCAAAGGGAPAAGPGRPAPPPAAPAVDERRGQERRARQQGAGRTARRGAQAMLSGLSGAGAAGDVPAAGAPSAPAMAFVGTGSPDGGMTPAEFARLNALPASPGPNTLRTTAPPSTAPKAAAPPPSEQPLWRRAWDATKDFVDRNTPSPYKLARDVDYEASQRFPNTSSHNTEQDAWRHARWHQRMVDSMCPETGRSVCAPVAAGVALAGGLVHELMGAASGQPAAEFKMDMSNNWRGALAGVKGGDPRLIDRELSSGALVVLEPSAVPVRPVPMVAHR